MQTGQANWFAVYTKARQEQIALENLGPVRSTTGVSNPVRFGMQP